MIGQAAGVVPTGGQLQERQFSSYLGSMLLSFCAIESFSASVAFSMPTTERFGSFDFPKYVRSRRFWDKLQMLCDAVGHNIDKSQGLFQTISEMQQWRNLVTHSAPYRIESTTVPDTTHAPGKLHSSRRAREYTRKVDLAYARKFYEAAVAYVDFLKGASGIEPRATAMYTVRSDGGSQ